MQRRVLLGGLGVLPLLDRPGLAAQGRVPVITSFSLLADMVRRIGGDSVTVTSLVPVDGDAHGYQPRPSDLRALAGAAMLVENGLGLEGWMARLTAATGFKGRRVIATAGITPRTMPLGTDPHAWQDPVNGVIYARNILGGLLAVAQDHIQALTDAADRYIQEIEQTDRWIAAQFAAIPPANRRIITTHDAFGYYGARYGIELLAAQGLSTEAEPSAKSIAALIAQIKRESVRAVFIENMTDGRLAKMLARETGAVVGGTVYSDALSPPGGPAGSYLAMLRHNTTLFAKAMGGAG